MSISHERISRSLATRPSSQVAWSAYDEQVVAVSSTEAQTQQLLTWLEERPRTYDEALEAWHSHCPRLTVWEDAVIAGLVRVERTQNGSEVRVTPLGRAALNGR
jgi:hypothetical protein